MTPELAWIFAVFRPSGKIEARFGKLPSPRQHIVAAKKLAEVRNELAETVELIDALMGDGNLTQ